MKPGAKMLTASEKRERGTFEPGRHGDRIAPDEDAGTPQQPEWLSPFGKEVWLDNVDKVCKANSSAALDTDLLGNFCNLQGAVIAAWRSGGLPPITALVEVRRMMELLRIGGPSSRITKDGNGPATSNPFAKFGKRKP